MDDENEKRLFALLERIAENTQPPRRSRQIADLIGLGVTIGGVVGLIIQLVQFFLEMAK
jgi:preprotein translocase subunit Sss1